MSVAAQVQVVAGVGLCSTLLALAFGFYWKSRYHYAKAETYQEFADTFGAMNNYGFGWGRDERATKIKDRERRRGWMQLMLCDPSIADALRDSLAEADEYWRRGEPAHNTGDRPQ